MEKKCCICGTEFIGYGNNAEPIKKGVCCKMCNARYVMISRVFNVQASYEIAKNYQEKQDLKKRLAEKNFELVRVLPRNELYENIETEEKVIICIVSEKEKEL